MSAQSVIVLFWANQKQMIMQAYSVAYQEVDSPAHLGFGLITLKGWSRGWGSSQYEVVHNNATQGDGGG